MAQQCSVKEITENQFHLVLHPKQKPLLQKRYLKQIGQALSKHLQREITVKIDISNEINTFSSVSIAQKKRRIGKQKREKNYQ